MHFYQIEKNATEEGVGGENKEEDKQPNDRILVLHAQGSGLDPRHKQKENIIKKLKGSGGIALKPREGTQSHSQRGWETAGRVLLTHTLPKAGYQLRRVCLTLRSILPQMWCWLQTTQWNTNCCCVVLWIWFPKQ